MLLGHLALGRRLGFQQSLDPARLAQRTAPADPSPALAFIEAASRCGDCADALAESVLAEVRRLFSEAEIAELARCLADHHFLDDSIP